MPGRVAEEKKPKESEIEKKVKKSEKKLNKEIAAEEKEPLSTEDKELLREAEEREEKRKEEEKAEKEAAKKAEKESKAEEKEEKAILKTFGRVKPRHGKNYRKAMEQLEKNKEYPVSEAIDLVLKSNPSKFDATVEAHVKINMKEKNIRGMVNLAGGVVKEKKILEVNEKNIDEAIENIKAGKFDFDIMITELKLMPKLSVLAKILGPKGLMPSPKAGTAVEDVAKAAEDLRSGKVEYRADKTNIVHMPIGKISFGAERVYQNYEALIGVLPYKKIDSIYLTTTMGPSIKVAKK
jgi:large subunit ribosomal protein L1